MDRCEYFKRELFPLYEQLFQDVPNTPGSQCAFVMQWGEDFPKESNKGVLFVGRAVNEYTERKNVELLFNSDNEFERGFAKPNQLKWVEDQWRNSNNRTGRSSFWRVIKNTCINYYSPWYSQIAWTNLCKLSPVSGGNPSNSLFNNQLCAALKIFKKEVEILSPRLVILITGMNYADNYLSYMNDEEFPQPFRERVYLIKGVYYVLLNRPEGQPEKPYINKLKDIIEEFG